MTKFISKQVVIEAVQFDGTLNSAVEILRWAGPSCGMEHKHTKKAHQVLLVIQTPEGKMKATKGDWIIRGLVGEFYPCKPDVFEKKYERLEEIQNG